MFRLEDEYGNQDKMWRFAKDWKVIPTPAKHKMEDGGETESPDREFNYMMLGRMQSDNDYFLGNGNGNEPQLHQGSVEKQIAEMKRLWNNFSEDKKPEWLSMNDILEYETKMKAKLNSKTRKSAKAYTAQEHEYIDQYLTSNLH